MYTAYVIDEESRKRLVEQFPMKYETHVGHHITIMTPATDESILPNDDNTIINVVGIRDSGDGLEVLVVSVNGTINRPDGGMYHITWSLDIDKYSPKDSNELLASYGRYVMCLPVEINANGELLK